MRRASSVALLALIAGACLVGVFADQQLEISRLIDRNSELSLSGLEREQEMSDMRAYYEDQIANLTRQYEVLNSSYYELLRTHESAVSFDKVIYYPDAEVFWEPNASATIHVTVVDSAVSSESVLVTVVSSVDLENVHLIATCPGVFKANISAVGLRMNESPFDTSRLNVRYGDMIIAQYKEALRGEVNFAAAFFAFPEYIMDSVSDPTTFTPWEPLDSEGVLLVDYGPPFGVQYNPSMISAYGLVNYEMYVATGNIRFRQAFLVQANWLAREAEYKNGFSVWECRFDWPWTGYNATNPFVSAMAQGEGMSVLTRAYVLTGNRTYLDIAESAMHSFEIEMNAGGVRYTDSDGVWYEEIADIGALSGKVLNGFLFALFGLYEYWYETSNTRAYELFLEGAGTLSSNLHRYDTGSWSLYDLLHHSSASLDYHEVHIRQLRIIYRLTGWQTFLFYSDKFQSYIH